MLGFLAFLRLIGTLYFKKYSIAFSKNTPQTLFRKHTETSATTLEQHNKWLEDIRQTIWDRTQFEDEMLPSEDALLLHWKRVCWVLDMWRQSNMPIMKLEPMIEHGWYYNGDELNYEWDSELNIAKIKSRVASMLKGCKCRTGCTTAICGCRKRDQHCSEGCDCIGCTNRQDCKEVDEELDEIMEWVFGEDANLL